MQDVLGKKVLAIRGAEGFDTSTVISEDIANQLAKDYDFCVRYVSLGKTRESRDLSKTEVETILNSGLALMIVQHCHYSLSPDAESGNTDGGNAVTHVDALGIAKGITVWLDLENIAPDVSHSKIIDYCRSWYHKVKDANYTPGIYIGSNKSQLTGKELYDLPFHNYWKSSSDHIPIPCPRGFQMIQTKANERIEISNSENSSKPKSILIDKNFIIRDNGSGAGLPWWLVKDD